MAKTMKALLLKKHGTLDELQVVADYPVPQAVEGHVVIRVRASSFNYHDVFTMRGIDRKVGCMVVVRPDQYVATVLPLDDFAALAAYFDGFMLQVN